jgi:hypothetical protein
LFWIMRNGASVSQLLQVSVLPRGARIVRVVSMRVGMFIAVSGVRESPNYRADGRAADRVGGARRHRRVGGCASRLGHVRRRANARRYVGEIDRIGAA